MSVSIISSLHIGYALKFNYNKHALTVREVLENLQEFELKYDLDKNLTIGSSKLNLSLLIEDPNSDYICEIQDNLFDEDNCGETLFIGFSYPYTLKLEEFNVFSSFLIKHKKDIFSLLEERFALFNEETGVDFNDIFDLDESHYNEKDDLQIFGYNIE